MPVFAYRGLTADGRSVRGVVPADSARGARARLRRDGVFPTDVAEERGVDRADSARGARARLRRDGVFPTDVAEERAEAPETSRWTRGGRTRPTDLAAVSRQLATLLAAGMPVVEALGAVSEQTERPALARTLSLVRDGVTQGSSLAAALGEHPEVFPPLYVGMVRAGETAGALDLVLQRLATYTEAQARLRSKVRAALAYPVLMTVVSIGIVAFLLGFVVPRVTRIFAEQQQALPFLTRVLLGTSQFVADFWWLGALALAGGAAAWLAALRRPAGRLWLDRRLLALPVLGPIFTRVAVARFARTLATLLGNGIPLLAALEVAGEVVGNAALAAAIADARTAIREGQNLATPLRDAGLFPPLLIHMVSVGERSGELEGMLEKVADAYEQEIESSLATATSILEPVLIVVMGGIVLFIVLAIMLPIFEINALVR